jgi:LmbE family N-acetylglucosaminyl deacetylase
VETPHDQAKILCVTAHPDDEVFCAGGTLAKYAAAGTEVMVVSATRGEAGQIRDGRAATRRTLGAIRERELRASCALLGVRHARCLDYADGTLRDVAPRALAAEVERLLQAFRPDVVITFGPDGAYGHPDHVAVSRATTDAFLRAVQSNQATLRSGGTYALPAEARLYHSHFPRSRLLLSDQLAHWLVELTERFKGTHEFVRALCVFAEESISLRYAGDHVAIRWFPAGFAIIEQGETGQSLYLVLSGAVDVIKEEADGRTHHLARLGPGEFFGELALVHRQPRSAHVVAADDVTCLVLSSHEPSPFAGRGQGARLADACPAERFPADAAEGATTCVDVTEFVGQKFAALAAHRSQYPIKPELFPPGLLRQMFGREYFVRIYPPVALEDQLLPMSPR